MGRTLGSPTCKRLKQVPEILIVDFVVILHFLGLHERAEQTRTPIGTRLFEIVRLHARGGAVVR